MKICLSRFNIILLLLCCCILSACKTTSQKKSPEKVALAKKYKKEEALVQLHLGGAPNRSGRTIQVYRDKPIHVSVEANPFLDSRSITDAFLAEDDSGYSIQLQFNSHGAFVLDTVTTAHRGKHIIIGLSQPGSEQRWIAAPMIRQSNTSGVLTFTPDVSRDEAQRIVYGIKNTAAQIRRQERF